MAILWQKTIDNTLYEIRKAGNSTRLYTDGVFHSQHNPNHPITRSVWDLLMLPAFFYPAGSIRRALILGVGGGSVIHLLLRHAKPDEIVGVEINPVHITVAKQFFGVNKKIATLHESDAITWLKEYQGPPFDMIIDDLFGERDGEGFRAIPLNSQWLSLLSKHTTRHGLVVTNLISKKSLRQSAYFTNQRIARQFRAAFQFTLPCYENIIAAFLKRDSSSKQLRQHLAQTPGLNHRSGPNKLRFQVRKLG